MLIEKRHYVIKPECTTAAFLPVYQTTGAGSSEAHVGLHVRRIVCVGHNYAAHAREMGKDCDRDPSFSFSNQQATRLMSVGGGPVCPGDQITGGVADLGEILVNIVEF